MTEKEKDTKLTYFSNLYWQEIAWKLFSTRHACFFKKKKKKEETISQRTFSDAHLAEV